MKENRKCWIMRAAPAMGKTYRSREIQSQNPNTVIVSADDYWMVGDKYVFDASRLALAHKQCFDLFSKAVNDGKNVIIDNTNLNYRDMVKYIDYLVQNNNLNDLIYSIELVEVQYNDLGTAIKLRTNQANGKNIPENRMREMYKKFQESVVGKLLSDYKGKIALGSLDDLKNEVPWLAPVEGRQDVILCDLDGTLAIFEYLNGLKIRSPYDASKAADDIVCVPVAITLRGFFELGYEIIFVSGREDKFREPTMEFLKNASEQYKFFFNKLLMRKTGDSRSDVIVKKEIYEAELKDKYNILAVFDDRRQIIAGWRALGLYVFDCNYRNADF